jgi:hypothetical protein
MEVIFMTAPAFPTYPKLRRSYGGFNYGIFLALKALYNQLNNLTVIDPEEKLKIDALFDEVEKQIPEDVKLEDPKPKEDSNLPKEEVHKRGRPAKKKV